MLQVRERRRDTGSRRPQPPETSAGPLPIIDPTGHPATPDALFLPGSIGKVYTATVVMGLADEGKLDIDAPIRTYLPDFKTAD